MLTKGFLILVSTPFILGISLGDRLIRPVETHQDLQQRDVYENDALQAAVASFDTTDCSGPPKHGMIEQASGKDGNSGWDMNCYDISSWTGQKMGINWGRQSAHMLRSLGMFSDPKCKTDVGWYVYNLMPAKPSSNISCFDPSDFGSPKSLIFLQGIHSPNEYPQPSGT